MMSLVSHFSTFVLLLVAIVSTPVQVNALQPWEALVLVQDTQQYDVYGLFSTQFVGITLDERNWGYVYFECGDWADASYVLTLDSGRQTIPFFMSNFIYTFGRTGTWWAYLSMAGTTANVDWLQIRVVAYGHQGPITPLFDKPPRAWRWGYPPYGTLSPMISGTDTETSAPAPADGSAVALSDPTLITLPPRRPSKPSIAVWLAPLLVGIIMIAITIPIAIISYKKGQKNAKVAEVEVQVEAQDQQPQQQQQQGNNHLQVVSV